MRILCPLRIPLHEYGIIWGFRQAGCEVLILDGSPVTRRMLTAAVEDFRPDLLFSYGWWHGRLLPEDLGWVCSRYHLPHVYWASDDPTHHHTTSLPMARIACLIPTTTEELCSAYRIMGKKTFYLQFACNPEIHRRLRLPGSDRFDVVLIATNYSRYDPAGTTYRTHCARIMLDQTCKSAYALRVFGDGWDDIRSPLHLPNAKIGWTVPYEKQASIYAAARIVLGMQTECHWSTQTSCRVFEVLGCGAFLLAPSTRSINRLFEPGTHLQITHSPAETDFMIRYYLEHPAERERIAAAGQLEVYRKHSYRQRARDLLDKMAEEL